MARILFLNLQFSLIQISNIAMNCQRLHKEPLKCLETCFIFYPTITPSLIRAHKMLMKQVSTVFTLQLRAVSENTQAGVAESSAAGVSLSLSLLAHALH
jgi:hypothetical protein